MFDLITIGDSVIDTYIPILDAEVHSSKGGNDLRLCVRYGDKIQVGEQLSMVAGNAANNAVGASRLKLKTAIYTHVGNLEDDQDDFRIRNKLKKEGVDTRYIAETDKLPSNHNIVLNYKGERTILVHHQPWEYSLPDIDKTKWVYYTSLAETFIKSPLIHQLTNYLERSGAKLLYNPGTFQLQHGIKKFPKLLSLTEILVVNVEEAKAVLGISIEENVPTKKLLQELADLGPSKVIISAGKDGSYGYYDGQFLYLPAFPARLVEMTGAGDAFATGVLAGLFYGKDLSEAMRWGACNGASVVEQIGPQAGLLTYNKMQEKLKLNKKIVAKKI